MLEFECMNNEAEYEVVIQGLELVKDMNIKSLSIFGDLDLVVNQVKNRYGIKKCRLKAYAKKFWDLIDHFKAFNITFIHREKNHKVDSLGVTTSMSIPSDPEMPNSFKFSTLYKLVVLDNEEALQVFETDEKVHMFFVGSGKKE